MNDNDLDKILKWQSSPEVKLDLGLSCFVEGADALTEQVKTREGVRHLSANWKAFEEHFLKAYDIYVDMKEYRQHQESTT